MRYVLVLVGAALFAPAVNAADPPITFQTHPFERVLNDLRSATNLAGGEKAVKLFNDAIKDKLGVKGFEGLDLGKPIVGYVLIAPKLDDATAVIAFPITGEKEFLGLCDRWNRGEKAKDLGKGLYELPPLDRRYKARMKFANQYAYIAYGANPESSLDEKVLVAPNKLYDPAENAAFVGKFHFNRITPQMKLSLVSLLMEAKKNLLEKAGADEAKQATLKPVLAELEKLARRYLLLLDGAETAALRVGLDQATSDMFVEATLTPKPSTELAKQIAARKPSENRFSGLLTPNTVVGLKYTTPFFAEEVRNAYSAIMEQSKKDAGQNAPMAAKPLLEEFFKGQERTLKAGEGDMALALRGPDKNGFFDAVGAMSFEDPSALEKAFKKYMEAEGPPEAVGTFKWNAAKSGNVDIHVFKLRDFGIPGGTKIFGEDCSIAFAGAPKGIYVTFGPDAITTLKNALNSKPAVSPALDVVVNPAKVTKLVETITGDGLIVENVIGKEDKLTSAFSLNVTSGKELSIRFALNMRTIPRALFYFLNLDKVTP